MMVYWAHFKYTLAEDLEGKYLQDNRKSFDYPDTAYGKQNEFVIGKHYRTHYKAAEEERSGIGFLSAALLPVWKFMISSVKPM